MKTVTVATTGTPSSPLLPGGSGDVVFSVTNPNNFTVSIVGVSLQIGGVITPDASHSGSATSHSNPVVTLTVPSTDLPVSIPKDSTMSVDLTNAASMDIAATNNCQGATFNIPITITVHSSSAEPTAPKASPPEPPAAPRLSWSRSWHPSALASSERAWPSATG